MMTEAQFNVVKLMQKGDATPQSFGRHTGEPVEKMQAAFDAHNFEDYKRKDDIDGLMEKFFGGNRP